MQRGRVLSFVITTELFALMVISFQKASRFTLGELEWGAHVDVTSHTYKGAVEIDVVIVVTGKVMVRTRPDADRA